jgi:hypothetical protein
MGDDVLLRDLDVRLRRVEAVIETAKVLMSSHSDNPGNHHPRRGKRAREGNAA